MSHRPRQARLTLVGILASVLIAVTTAGADPCPTTVVFEGVTTSDIGFSGIAHGVDSGALAIPLAIANCAGSESGSCGSCDVSGPLVAPDGRNRRCRGDLSLQCTTDASCGTVGPCRTYAGPPGPIEAGGVEVCVVPEIAGPVTGTVEPDAGTLSVAVPIEMRTIQLFGPYTGGWIPPYFNPPYQPCPICLGGTCQGGVRDGLPCQVDAVNLIYGDTSFDCPSDQVLAPAETRFLSAVLPLSTGMQTATLGPDSPNCRGTGTVPPGKCYCDTCNDAGSTPCMTNADCVVAGATICGGKRCLKAGNPCVTHDDCPEPGDLCNRPGEPTKPYGCVPPGDGEPPDGCLSSGVCADGPIEQHCAAPEEHRFCSTNYAAETCPLTSSCSEIELLRCHYDDGSGVSVMGAANPPVGGVAPAAVGALFCSNVLGSSPMNTVMGFPGLVRIRSEGTLTFGDGPMVPAPTPQPTGTPLPTPVLGACPQAASASCRPISPRRAKLEIRRAGDLAKRALRWDWRGGTPTAVADFGDPVTSDPYDLCLYDQGALVASVLVAPGGTCSGKPCWRATPSGKITFRNRDIDTRAATRVDLKAGDAGKSFVGFRAAGPHLSLPDLATLTGPLVVQLRNHESGFCWGATFSAPFDERDLEKGTLKDKN